MAKKIFIAVIAFLFIGCAAFFIAREYVASHSDDGGEGTTAEKDILVLAEEYPTKILVYGEMLEFDAKISTENITEITYETLEKDDEFVYELIVINDLSGEYPLSDEQWKIIKDVVDAGKNINFLYLGNKQFDKICEAGIVDADITAFEDGDMSVGAFYEGKTKISVYGTYTSASGTTQRDICEAIMREEVYSIEMGNE